MITAKLGPVIKCLTLYWIFDSLSEKYGVNMTLIFLHGSGCTANVWAHQTASFEHSMAINFPGHPEGEALSSVADLADWLASTIKEQSLQDVVLVGHSLGGAVALQTALLGLEQVKALVLIGSGARLKVMPQILTSLSQLVEAQAEIPDSFLMANQKIEEPLKSEINASLKANGASVLLTDFTACDRFDVMEKLSDITLPVQIIVGEADVMTPVKYAKYMDEQLPSSQLHVIEKGTHMVFAEQPEAVNKLIQAFINNLK